MIGTRLPQARLGRATIASLCARPVRLRRLRRRTGVGRCADVPRQADRVRPPRRRRTRDHRAAADAGRRNRVGQPLSMVAGAREHRAPVQPRPLRGRPRRRDARQRTRRAALRAHPDSSGRRASDLPVAAVAPGIDAGALRRAIVDRYGASPPLGRVADMTRICRRRAARARLPACERCTPRPELEHAPERATLVFSIDPGPRTTIGTVDVDGGRPCRARELLGRARARAGRAVPARAAQRADRALHRGAPAGRLLRGENHAGGRARRRRSRREHHVDRHRRAARARRVRRRPAAVGQARRARAGRARRIGRRGSARGREQPDRGVPARAGLSRRRGAAHARGEPTASS